MRRCVVLLALLTACKPDQGVSVFNAPPDAAFIAPADGAHLPEGQVVLLRGQASDPDDGLPDLVGRFVQDGTNVCDPSAPDADGEVRCEHLFGPGLVALTFEVTDSRDAADSDGIAFTIDADAAPSVSILSPATDSSWEEGDTLAFTAHVSDDRDDPTALVATWTSGLAGALDLDETPDGDGNLAAFAVLGAGTHVITLEVEDTTGHVGEASVAIIVVPPNQAPSCAITAPADGGHSSLGAPVQFEGLVDDDGPLGSLVVTWTTDQESSAFATSVPNSAGTIVATRSDLEATTHRITLRAEDADGLACTDTILWSVGAPPTVAFVTPADGSSVGPGLPVAFDALTSDGETPVTNLVVSFVSDVTGALGTVNPDSAGHARLTANLPTGAHAVTARATDSDGLYATDDVVVTVLANTPPVTGRPTLSPVNPTEAGSVLCTPGATTDVDGTTSFTYRYEWRVNSVLAPETSSSLPPSQFAKHDEIVCGVAANDGADFGVLASSLPVTVRNTPPDLSTPVIAPNPAFTNSALTVTAAASDLDGDTVTTAASWRRNTIVVASAPTLDGATMFQKGDRISVTLTPWDGEANGAARTSADLIISNGAPTAPVVAVAPDEPVVDEDALVCAVTGPATDPDGDTVAYAYTWTVDNVSYTPPTDPRVVPLADPNAGELWTCAVSASDGLATGPAGVDSVRELLYGHVQWPCPTATGSPGETGFAFYGVVYDPDTTPGPGPGGGIQAEVGIGPDGTDPRVASGWTWFAAVYNRDIDAFAANDLRNDEYVGYATLPGTTGSYDFAFRFRPDTQPLWAYMDLGTSFGPDACDAKVGNSDGYSPLTAGDLLVQ